MIHSVAYARTEDLCLGIDSARIRQLPPDIQKRAFKKMVSIDAAEVIADLRMPPTNRLHALRDDRKGQHSISVNDQWRLCFRWDGGAHDVELVDYR